jgi:hypothetical protein
VRKAKAENRAGVTTALQWSRVDGFDLLDSPGIIPARMLNQEIAVHLAICDDIGKASYDTILVAAAFIDEVRKVGSSLPSYTGTYGFSERYGLALGSMSGEEYIYRLAQQKFLGLELAAAERVLFDFRGGRLGVMTLEPPPSIPYHTGFYRKLGLKKECSAADVKRAFRDKARTMHPDAGGDRDQWQRVLDAYEVLSDEGGRRARYDAHGLVWDIKAGSYRVLEQGEVVPTIKTMMASSPKLLTAGGQFNSIARVRKGQLRISLQPSARGSRGAALTARAPRAPPSRRRGSRPPLALHRAPWKSH